MPAGTRPAPPDGACRLAVEGTIFGVHPWANVFWLNITKSGAAVLNDLSFIIDAIEASWNTNIKVRQCNDVITTDFKASWYYAAGSVLAYDKAVSLTGTTGGTLPDAAASYVIDHVISDSYRGGHPRTYQAGVLESAVVSGSIVGSATRALLVTAWDAWRNDINALTHGNITAVKLGTVSFVGAKAWRTPPIFRPYTSCRVRTVMGNQRRRLG